MEQIITAGHNDIQFTNKALQNATMLIMTISNKIRNNWFEIGAIIADVDAGDMYKDDGFKDVHEWTAKAFNIKKSMSYDLLKIGKEYTRQITNKAGRIAGYECNLVEPGEDNFNPTQVIRMLPAGHDTAQKLVNDGVITPDMSAAKIAKIVKGVKGGDTTEEEQASGEGNKDNPGDKSEVDRGEWLRMTFDKITTAELIEELNKRGFTVLNERG